MNFHAIALLAFIAFHVIVTGGGLMFDQVAQALGHGANDAQLVGAVLLGLWCLSSRCARSRWRTSVGRLGEWLPNLRQNHRG